MDILQRLQSRNNRVSGNDEDGLIQAHHILMCEYGWIPLEEFRSLPLPTLWNLLDCIKKDKEAEAKAMKKSRKR